LVNEKGRPPLYGRTAAGVKLDKKREPAQADECKSKLKSKKGADDRKKGLAVSDG